MNTVNILRAIEKYGINAILVVAVIWMNGRVSEVEDKLYDCFQLRIEEKGRFDFNGNLNSNIYSYIRKYAILPDEIKIVQF